VLLASRLVQDMAQVFGISALASEADFPADLESLRQLLLQVAEYNANRIKLSTDMADMSTMIKERIVKAEDCRLISDFARARAAYVEIHDINLKLRQQYTKRETNHNELLACLKARLLSRAPLLMVAGLAHCTGSSNYCSHAPGRKQGNLSICFLAGRRFSHQINSCCPSR
jgi:hypothetical protein